MDERMDEMFEEVLAICLDRLSDGDTVAACVADYPDCPDLEPLLEIATALSTTSEADHRRGDRQPTWLQPRRDEIRLRPTG
jgi:hypothetical protein